MFDLFKHLANEWQVIKGAKIAFALALIAGCLVGWFAIHLFYSSTIETQQRTIDALKSMPQAEAAASPATPPADTPAERDHKQPDKLPSKQNERAAAPDKAQSKETNKATATGDAAIAGSVSGSNNQVNSNNQITINPQNPPAIPEETLIEIGKLADAGKLIQDRFIASNDVAALSKERSQWIREVSAFLSKNVRESVSIQFRNSQGSAFMGCPNGRSIDGCGNWQDVQGKRDFLMKLR